jgi:hypothetical protein
VVWIRPITTQEQEIPILFMYFWQTMMQMIVMIFEDAVKELQMNIVFQSVREWTRTNGISF